MKEDESIHNNNNIKGEGSPPAGRGKADGRSTESVHGQHGDRGDRLTGAAPAGVDPSGGGASSPGPRELRQVARDASDVRHYYHTQIAPVSKGKQKIHP